MRTAGEIRTEIEGLTAKLKKREGKPGFTQNVEAIKARIEECQAELSDAGN
jgi:hypothetical protein